MVIILFLCVVVHKMFKITNSILQNEWSDRVSNTLASSLAAALLLQVAPPPLPHLSFSLSLSLSLSLYFSMIEENSINGIPADF